MSLSSLYKGSVTFSLSLCLSLPIIISSSAHHTLIPRMATHPSQAGRKSSARKPVQKATVIETVHKILSQAASPVDQRILDRIQKCLNRAYHANTSEAEAKAALFVSQKLMSQHNVTQADLMASDNNSNKAHYGGRSVVSIARTASSSKRVIKEAFAMKLATTMGALFD